MLLDIDDALVVDDPPQRIRIGVGRLRREQAQRQYRRQRCATAYESHGHTLRRGRNRADRCAGFPYLRMKPVSASADADEIR